MKTSTIIFRGMALISIILLTGCAGNQKMTLDGKILSMQTVGDTLDRSASFTGLYEEKGVNPDGSPKYEMVSGQLSVGSTVVGDTIKGATPAAIVTYGQYKAAVRSSEIKAKGMQCPDGTTNCYSTVIGVGGASAVSDSTAGSQSVVDVDVDAGLGGPCMSGNCAAIPMD